MVNAYSLGYDILTGRRNPYVEVGGMFTGRTQMKNTQASIQAQIDYEQYLKAGNERALRDWHKNVPGRYIKYPEFSYAGQIYRADTSIASAGFNYDNAFANYVGSFPYKSAGLYGIGSRLSRSL